MAGRANKVLRRSFREMRSRFKLVPPVLSADTFLLIRPLREITEQVLASVAAIVAQSRLGLTIRKTRHFRRTGYCRCRTSSSKERRWLFVPGDVQWQGEQKPFDPQ